MEQVTSTLARMDWLEHLLETLDDRTAWIVVVGQGYVGLPVAMRAVEVGFPVVGFDTSTSKSDSLARAVSYVGDVTSAQLGVALERGYLPTSNAADLEGFDVAVITVPTPLRDGAPDLTFIESAARALADHVRTGCLVILESTTYPGTTEELLVPILERSGLRAGLDFSVGYSPERIDPGNPKWTFVNTPKVVSGVDDGSRRAVQAFYDALIDETVPVGSTGEAELVKLLENTFRHVNIALVNELAMFARDLGVDIWSAIDATSTKPFGYMRFTPGTGSGRPLPADRPVVPRVAGGTRARRPIPVRGARQRRQPTHAGLRRHPRHGPPQRADQAGAREPRSRDRARVQGRHLGLARIAVDPGHRAARRTGRRRAGPRRPRPSAISAWAVAGSPATRRRSMPPTSSSSWSITPTFRTT